jgi:2-dehydropantoate 2-reductase
VRIAVVGAGGIGGLFGGRLARAGERVALVARGAHLAAIRAEGLRVRSPDGDFTVRPPATDAPAEVPALIGVPDLVLFCVKSYDTGTAAEALRPLLGPDTALLTLQNGVANVDVLAERLGRERVLGGLVYGFAVVERPGVVRHTQGGRVVLGELDGVPRPRVGAFLAAAARAGIPAEASPDIRRALWEKYVMICALAGATAVTRRPVGEIRACPEARRLYRLLVEETAALAPAAGVSLPADTVARTVAALDAWQPDTYSSLYHDLVQGRRLELEALHGHAVRLGERHGVPTPTLFAVYAALRPAARLTDAGP